MSNTTSNLIPMGIDIGSLHARVAIGDPSSSIQVVSNAQGQRYTVAISAVEESNQHGEPENNNTVSAPHYIFGEAARKAKKGGTSSSVRNLVRSASSHIDEEDTLTGEEKKHCDTVGGEEASMAASAFFGYLGQLACDASSGSLNDLRCVVSVPYGANEVDRVGIIETVKRGIQDAIVAGGAGVKKSKNKKMSGVSIMGILSDPAAVCVAHGLTEDKKENDGADWRMNDAMTIKLGEEEEDQKVAPAVVDTWKKCLVIDWGASGITVSTVVRCGSGSESKMLSISRSEREPSCSGTQIVQVLVKHCASMFERKTRVRGVLDNKKSVLKLTTACEAAVRTLARTNTANISVDGVYDGMDLHVAVSRPRFDMLCAPLIRKAEAIISKVATEEEGSPFDVVLTAGNVCEMPAAVTIINKIFPDAWRGDASIPVDEAVAMGCAKHAELLVKGGYHDEEIHTIPEEPAQVSPVSIGVSLLSDEDGTKTATLIPNGAPLPACCIKNIQVKGDKDDTLAISELCADGCRKGVLAQIALPEGVQNLDLYVELSLEGQLSISVNGSDEVTI